MTDDQTTPESPDSSTSTAVEIPSSLIDELRQATRVVVSTGAGVSAESGVPTFRDAQTGLWARYSPEQLATPEAFEHDPALVWRWYLWRRQLVAEARPNPGHVAIARLEELVPQLTLITQNVDSLHQRAGSHDVIELHGNIMRTRCHRCCLPDDRKIEADRLDDEIPRCGSCGAMLRPDVVWFGEALPEQALRAALEASASCDLLLSVGTSALVYPAAGLPYQALGAGRPVVEINPQPTPLSDRVTYRLAGASGRVLPALLDAVWPG
jgi:NAD-dependent deacetylase